MSNRLLNGLISTNRRFEERDYENHTVHNLLDLELEAVLAPLRCNH